MSEILDQLFDATNPALIDQLYTSLYDSPNIETVLANILETGSSPEILAEVQTRVSESDFWSRIRSSVSNEKGEHVVFQQNKELSGTYTSFSGADTTVSIAFKGGQPIVIGTAQTVTYSIFRPMSPVYNLGSAKPAGFVRGQRTIAGSIIFTVFDRHVLLAAMHSAYAKYNADCLNKPMLADELPPFDLEISFTNEYGQSAFLLIYGVHITSEGQVMSIEDMITENTMQYLAEDIMLMKPDFAENI